MSYRISSALVCAMALASQPLAVRAESPRYIDLEGFSRLLDGNPQTTALSEEGAIGLSLRAQERFVDPAVTLGAACLFKDDVIAVQVGEHAQIIAIDAQGKKRILVDDLAGDVVTKLAVHQDVLVVATAPKPKLLFVKADKSVTAVSVPDVGFVWDMVTGGDGSLIVAAGEPGKVLRLDKAGKWHTLFEADEAHIKALVYDAKLGLFAGGGERGVVYHGGLDGNFRALFDSGHTEVTALAVDGDDVYAATVSGAQAIAAAEDAERKGQAPQKPAVDVRSALTRIGLDGSSDILAGSTDEIVFDIVRERPGSMLIATGAVGRKDAKGRLYRLDPKHKNIALLHQSASRRLVRLLAHPSGTLLGLGQDGTRLTTFSAVQMDRGIYISPAFDTGVNSQFGAVQALGDFPKGSRGTLSVRSGQTAEPDASWSNWSADVEAPVGQPQGVPHGRYAQIRLTLMGKPQAQPEVIRLRLAYLRQNLAPFIREVTVMDKGLTLTALPPALGGDDSRTKVVVLNERPSDEAQNTEAPRRNVVRAKQSQERGALTVRWSVDDPNGDELLYTLWIRALHDTAWRTLQSDLTDPFFTLKSSQLPDGYYLFRVQASDARSNPPNLARQDTRQSRAILIDNTPPVFSNLSVRVSKQRATLVGTVQDAAGLLTALTYSVDGGPMLPLAPADGVLDGPKETLATDLGEFAGGVHTLTVVAVDEAHNEAFSQLSFKVPLGRAQRKE